MGIEDKLTAVVLAGGNKKFSFKELFYQLEDLIAYKEWYFRIGYKSLRRIKRDIDGIKKPRPMVEYTLNMLTNIERFDKILVVGPEKEMKEKINPCLVENSRIEIIQQTESFGGNVKKGYDAAGKEYVFFMTADSPTTKEKDVCEFLGLCDRLDNAYDVVYPIVKKSLLEKHSNHFPRLYFNVFPDNFLPEDYIKEEDLRDDGRVGVRITSMTFANLSDVSVKMIDEAYDTRKFLRKSNWDKLRKAFGRDIIERYRCGLTISEIEELFFNYEKKTIKIVGLSGAGSSLDVDSTQDERVFNNLHL